MIAAPLREVRMGVTRDEDGKVWYKIYSPATIPVVVNRVMTRPYVVRFATNDPATAIDKLLDLSLAAPTAVGERFGTP